MTAVATFPRLWTIADLLEDELRAYAMTKCDCKTSTQSGTRSGYRCIAHRSQDELDRREVLDAAS